jgi:hypothetical protein
MLKNNFTFSLHNESIQFVMNLKVISFAKAPKESLIYLFHIYSNRV